MQNLVLLVSGVLFSFFQNSIFHTHTSATASYRLLPYIKITKPIPPHLAERFQKCFSPGVIKIDPQTKEVTVDADGSRKDLVSREVLRHPEFVDSVELSRVKDFFLCELSNTMIDQPSKVSIQLTSSQKDPMLLNVYSPKQ